MEPPTYKPSRMHLIRNIMYGSGANRRGSGSAFYNAGRIEMLGTVDSKIPFDIPPTSPIELEGDIPWELREEIPFD